MRAQAIRLGLGLVRTAAAAAVSFGLFVLIPLIHQMFGSHIFENRPKASQTRIVAEMVTKPEQREEKKQPQRMRRVQSSGSERAPAQRSMAAKFTPDLAADGGGEGVALQSQELAAEVFEEGQTDEPAVEMHNPAPAYPDRAREMGIAGTVETRFTVTHEGKAASLEIRSSPHPLLTAEVRRALSQWRFKPASNKGVPVNVRVSKSFAFTLD